MLDRARTAFGERHWSEAYLHLSTADRERALDVDDLERLAIAAHITGHRDEEVDAFARAYSAALRGGDHARAARFAFWSGLDFIESGEGARALGWFTRANTLLDEHDLDCVERGYLRLPAAFAAIERGEIGTACDIFGEAMHTGERFADADLAALARQARGRALVHLGQVEEGLACIDEVMIAITAGDVSPLVVGNVYCSAIEACRDMFDLRRAAEWTAALTRWCESQPDLVPHRGQCLVYRAELMRLHGAWPDAMEEAQRARGALSRNDAATGSAFYQQGELHRLRGELALAEEAFRAASAAGQTPQPGLALLRLAQGRADVARTSIQRVLDETPDPLFRSRFLPAAIEIALAQNDIDVASKFADELLRSSDVSLYLRAVASHARGSVLLASGDAKAAVASLRAAWSAYRECGVPYEAARVREQLGLAYRTLGDEDSAKMEFDASRSVFEQLRAAPDVARLDRYSTGARPDPSGLTARELEVLVLVARGKTNRDIAADLVISEKTVARHVSNIFSKLSVSSRSAMTAYAYEHGLVGTTT